MMFVDALKYPNSETIGYDRGDRGKLLQFSVKVTFCEEYVRCIISANVYVKFIIRVNKMYHTIDIPYCS